jgi:hypothetical protein
MEDNDFNDFIESVEKEGNDFWEIEYPKMSKNCKIDYWLGSTSKGMRNQGEIIKKYSII